MPAQLSIWFNGEQAATGKGRRTVPVGFTRSETFDVGTKTSSPGTNGSFDWSPFAFEGTLKKLSFKNLPVEQPALVGSPDHD